MALSTSQPTKKIRGIKPPSHYTSAQKVQMASVSSWGKTGLPGAQGTDGIKKEEATLEKLGEMALNMERINKSGMVDHIMRLYHDMFDCVDTANTFKLTKFATNYNTLRRNGYLVTTRELNLDSLLDEEIKEEE